ncbi:alpha/beta hydrolase fold domain-containing protein [Streptomyces sp. SID8361]|uniref:alpha/beta hydrolase n=1 Tax=Streptomyces TaxID=1883 RepID=UPI00081E9048|nr:MULTISPECIES: alpha/beta hydrolase [unclassified Streptomyces]AUA17275.1 Carboxylesterase NlhH [Streptomyces sp. M56]MYU10035.1 alpha/beta hydrolase fold domain-containing protein [Streptomyces sp. SID8361]MYX59076.1 alpha/beta hydrolase fold domain-containing protein [Streptomyces sp. SID8382]SCF67671.1 Acetyl esterase/lipase [Streptomyces sp. MnatMP-M27]
MTDTLARPPFDPELQAVLDLLRDQLPVGFTAEMIPLARQDAGGDASVDDVLAEAGVSRRDVRIPGYEGADIVVSVLAREDHTGLGPGIFHTHGGGMILGDRFLGLPQILPWIVEHDSVAVTVEYRLAPEYPDPYPVEDCYAGLLWTAEHAEELGIDPGRLIIAGASAGGGLAAGTALLARDRQGPRLAGQVLIYPMLDDRDQTVSTAQIDGIGAWDRVSNLTGWTALLGDRRGTTDVSVYAAPARATDLSGLPPAFIDCGSAEVFRDEDVAYASALWEAGVQAELHVWPGGFHGFDVLASHTPLAQAMTATRNAWVARHIGM